jgi:hypothetical protein
MIVRMESCAGQQVTLYMIMMDIPAFPFTSRLISRLTPHAPPKPTFPDFAPSWIELGDCASAMQTMLLGLPRMFCGRAAQL